jgi:ribonuclease-3
MSTKLNIKNRWLSKKDVQNILSKGGIHEEIKHLHYYQQAFTHSSYTTHNGKPMKSFNQKMVPLQPKSYQVFEFGGDSIISQNICLYLIKRYPHLEEGDLTKLKTNLVDTSGLSKIAEYLDFSKFVLLSHRIEQKNGRKSNKIMEDVFEAFIYALYRDLGGTIAKNFILNLLEEIVDFAELNDIDTNYKHQLLKQYQKMWNLTPNYEKISEIGPPQQKMFKMVAVDYLNNHLGSGVENQKKKAEQLASQEAIERLTKIEEILDKMEEDPDFIKQIREELEFQDLTVKDAEDIVELVENLKQKISEIVLEDSLAEKLTGTIENVLKNNKTFEICFTIHGEKQNKTISYKEEEYEKYQDIFSDNRKFRYYIMAFEWLIRRNL